MAPPPSPLDEGPRDATPAEVHGGRLAVYAALGASVGALPLPWLPDSLMHRIRGALVRDVAARHGCTLAPGAREALSAPESTPSGGGLFGQAARYVRTQVLRRIGPVGFLPPLQFAIHTFALGHLLDRYLGAVRAERSTVIDRAEAEQLRAAIDIAIGRAVMTKGNELDKGVPDGANDAVTEFLDIALGGIAGVPEWLEGRLDRAFDLAWQSRGGGGRG